MYGTFINDFYWVSFFLEFVIRHDEMLQERPSLASHVLDQILRDKTKVFFYLFDQSITILQVQMPKTKNILQIISQKLATNIQSFHRSLESLSLVIRGNISCTFRALDYNGIFIRDSKGSVLQIGIIEGLSVIINQLGRRLDIDAVKSKVLQIDLHMSLHHFTGMVRQDGQSHREILAVEACGFPWHVEFSHQLIKHVNIGLKSNSDSPHIILFIDELSLIQNVIQSWSKHFVTRSAINSNKVIVDDAWSRREGISKPNRVAAAIKYDPSFYISAPRHYYRLYSPYINNHKNIFIYFRETFQQTGQIFSWFSLLQSQQMAKCPHSYIILTFLSLQTSHTNLLYLLASKQVLFTKKSISLFQMFSFFW